MAKNEIGTRFSHPIVSSRASRSGERYSNRYAPSIAWCTTHDCTSAASELFSSADGIPICVNCATWSCISAISGDTTTTVFSAKIAAGN